MLLLRTEQDLANARERLDAVNQRLGRIAQGQLGTLFLDLAAERSRLEDERVVLNTAIAQYHERATANENAILDAFLTDPDGNKSLPACCYVDSPEDFPALLYAAYNRGGDPATAGLNYAGQPCPTWEALPENVKAKWNAVASVVAVSFNVFLRKPR